ncbi:MAG: serine/threonine protein kinase, partial [Deltaproteobacteria bacterium]
MEEPLQKSLERYDVLDRIAVGGMAEVFLAKAYGAHGFEKTLAIKRILPDLASDPEFAARFIAEAKVAVRLSHANVVQVFDFGRIGESLFIAMEFVDGLDLAALLRRFKDEHRQIVLPAAFHIAIEIVRALDFAHSHNVVHRDVSPSNILISRAGEVKIADFGIATAPSSHRGGGTGPRKVMGKWRYMSPEQARGDVLDTRSDLFSAASVMFELFTGEKLFPGDEV